MYNTIKFQDMNGRSGATIITVGRVEDKPGGLEIEFNKGVDERTRRAAHYSAVLYPAVKKGDWKTGDVSGQIEQVSRKDLGPEVTVSGIWVENGIRTLFEVYFTK